MSVWSVYLVEAGTEVIEERLYLPLLGSVVWIACAGVRLIYDVLDKVVIKEKGEAILRCLA